MDPASLDQFHATSAGLLDRLEGFAASGVTGLDEFKAVVADIEARLAAAKSGTPFDPRSLIPAEIIGLKAVQAAVSSPVAKLGLAIFIAILGKFAPAPVPVPNPPVPAAQ